MREIFEPIRDHYVFAEPCEALTAQIEFFSESIVNDYDFSVEMFPSWTPTMYINLGPAYRITLQDTIHPVDTDSDILVLRDCKTIRHNNPGDRIFTIKFRPGGLEQVLGFSQVQLKRKLVSLRQVFGPAFLDEIKRGSSLLDRQTIVEQYFMTQMKKSESDHYINLVRDIAQQYEGNRMSFNVSQLSEKYFITSRTINRYFHRVVGTSPKNYFSILRAREALQVYTKKDHAFDPCNFGYYDASHFYKEAATFTGLPLRVLKNS